MAPQLFPANPSEVMVIRNVTSNVITLSLPFARFGRLKFGGRGTLGSHFVSFFLTQAHTFPVSL